MPTAIGERSAQLSFLRAREAKEVRRILRWLSAQVGLVSESLLGTLETMAELDRIHARARLAIDYRMTAPRINQEGRLVLRAARHPLLEALFRGDPAIVPPPEGKPTGNVETGIGLHTDDIAGDHADLKARGVDVDPEVSRMGYPVPPLFWFRDPDGNSLMVVETR